MKRNLTYVPKDKKVNYYIVVLLLFLIIGASVGYYKIYFQEEDESMYYTFCDLNAKQTQNILNKRQNEYNLQPTITVSDYGVYGETLDLFHAPYQIGKVDEFSGNTLFLKNLCQTSIEDKLPFLMSGNLDVGIEMDQLEDGLYEAEILSDFKFQRLKGDRAFDETFYSAKKQGVIKKVRLFSDKSIINAGLEDDLMLDNYLFLEVTSIEDHEAVDVVLNPSRFTISETGAIDMGHFYGDIEEANETYRMAKKVKDILEEKNIRVELLRDNDKPSNNFGPNGRVKKAYELEAKYMVNMRYESSGSQMDHGIVVLYPEYVSNRFAANMAKKLLNETSLNPSPYDDYNNPKGVFKSQDNAVIYYSDIVRETGGFLTGAGIREPFQDMASFSKDSRMGMNTVDIIYGYMTHPEDRETWNKEFDLIAEKTAEGILVQMGLMGD